MTLKRLTLISTALMCVSFGLGCTSRPNTSPNTQTVRLGVMDTARNPLAMGAGDALGARLHGTHGLN